MDRKTMATSLQTSAPTTNKHLIRWIEKMADLTQPERIHWCDGSQQEYDQLGDELEANGTFTRLNQKLWPGCFLARSDPRDVARVEERTLSARSPKMPQGQRTTGRTHSRCGASSNSSSKAACADA